VALPPMEAFSLLRNWRGGGDGDTAIGIVVVWVRWRW